MPDFLVEQGLVSEADLARASDIGDRTGARLAATLVRLGMISDATLASTFAQQLGYRLLGSADLERTLPDIPGLNPHFLLRRSLFPLSLDGGRLEVAIADPQDDEALAAIAFAGDAEEVVPVIASFSDIDEALGRHFPAEEAALDPAFANFSDGDDMERLSDADSDAPVIRLVHRLLGNAVSRRASDVHIEPMARHLVVRYRVDGRLTEVERLADGMAAPIASRVKVMAGLDIAETRLPQDGRLRLTVKGRDVDVRVSTSPVAHGESIVLRLLGQSSLPLDLEQLGLPPQLLEKLLRALARPHGMILLTGPTGSGKTTTLYAAINHLRAPDVKILTVEDPVEVMLDGINQVHVRPDINLTYASALRAFLRQDPDILMIGEIRDRETADIAMRAALTGHLVLSTLHTNSALGAFTRLADIGIEPFLTASTVIATIAQRLVRKLCPDCAEFRPPTSSESALFGKAALEPPQAVGVSLGCPACGHTGYRGRLPIMEIVEIGETEREAIRTGQTDALEQKQHPANTLFGHGLSLVTRGVTDIAEVERAVQL
jgi:general secretion pathway protein E